MTRARWWLLSSGVAVLVLALLALAGAGPSGTTTAVVQAQAVSPGCAELNQPIHDGQYYSWGQFNGELITALFNAGDQISVTAQQLPLVGGRIALMVDERVVQSAQLPTSGSPITLVYTFSRRGRTRWTGLPPP